MPEIAPRRCRIILTAILLVAAVLRLYHLNAPLIGVHSWRQTDTAAIARNFYQHGFNLFYPQIDWGGNSAGYVETEFQIFPYLVALLYKVFGFNEMWGRLLATVCSVSTIYFLFRFVARHIDERTALWSGFCYAVLPLNIYYGRTFMPEAAMMMSSVAALDYFSIWTETGKLRHWLVSLLFVSLACTIKIPCLYLGIPLLYLAWLKFGKQVWREPLIWVYFGIGLCATIAWYYHAHQILHRYGLTFGIWEYGSDKWGNWSVAFSGDYWGRLLTRLTLLHFAIIGLPLFFIGIFLKRQSRKEGVFDAWLAAILLYLLVVARGNYVHEYYQMPLMLPAAVFIGKVFGRYFQIGQAKNLLPTALLTASGMLMLYMSALIYSNNYLAHENPATSPEYALGQLAQRITPPGSLVVAVDNQDPTLLYLMHRKGWHAKPEEVTDAFLQTKARQGASYIVGLKSYFKSGTAQRLPALLLGRQALVNDTRFFVVKLTAS